MNRSSRTTPSRRLGTAFVILVVGGAIAVWSSIRSAQHAADIETFIDGLCEAAAAGQSITQRAPGSSIPVMGAVQASLTGMFDGAPEVMELIDVEVRPGDIESYGDGRATHNAVIHLADRPQLGLRIHRGSGGAITIVGYWKPRDGAH